MIKCVKVSICHSFSSIFFYCYLFWWLIKNQKIISKTSRSQNQFWEPICCFIFKMVKFLNIDFLFFKFNLSCQKNKSDYWLKRENIQIQALRQVKTSTKYIFLKENKWSFEHLTVLFTSFIERARNRFFLISDKNMFQFYRFL